MTDIDHTPDPLKNKINQSIEKIESQGEPEPYYDFCAAYQLEDGIQDNLFNQEFNQPHLLWIFIDPETGKNTSEITGDMLDAISTRIYNYSHVNLFIFGPTDSGKSEGAQGLGDYYQKEFYRLHKLNVKIPITFSDADIDDIAPMLEYGSMVIRDESSSVTGDDSGILKTKIGNLIRAIRIEQNSFIYVNPDVIEVPLVDYYLRTAGKKGVYKCNYCDEEYLNIRRCPECYSDLETVHSKCKTRFIVYVKRIDPLSNRASFIPLGRMYLGLHDNQELREEYERKKRENAQYLKKHSGLVEVHKDRILKEAQILAKECLKDNITSKVGMEVKMIEYNTQFTIDDADKMIGGTVNHNRLLFEATVQLLKRLQDQGNNILLGDDQEDQIEVDPYEKFKGYTFPYSEDDILNKAKQNANFRDIDRDFEIYRKKIKDGLLLDEIYPHYPDLTGPSSVTKVVKKVRGLINKVSGSLFENEYVKHLQTIYEDKVIHDGRNARPDAYVFVEALNELHVFSLKNISTKFLSRKELKPEQEFAFENRLEYKKVKLFHIANINNKIYVKEETNLSLTEDLVFN